MAAIEALKDNRTMKHKTAELEGALLDGTGGLYAPPSEEAKARRRAWFHETRASLTGEDLEEFEATAERWRRRGVDPETMNPDNWHPLPSARKRIAEFAAEALKGPR